MGVLVLMGGINIVLGIVSIVFYSIIVGLKVPMYHTGCGLWSGALLVLAGLMGIYAGKAKHRMAHSFALLAGVIALIADIVALALSIYVFYYLTQVYPDNKENMPIYQVYLAFHSLWFLTVLASFFASLLLVKTAWSKMPEPRQKSGEVFVDAQNEPPRMAQPAPGGYHQPPPGGYHQASSGGYHHPSGYQPAAPRPYYY